MRQCIASNTQVCDRIALLKRLALQGSHTEAVAQFAQQIVDRAKTLSQKNPARSGHWFEELVVIEALRAVQSLPYVADPIEQDCYQDVETTLQRGGECKALNVLLVALLMHWGIRAEIEWIMQPNKPLNHVAVSVYLGGRWYWADASIQGALFGESPYQALKRTGAYHVVGGKPV